MVISSFSPVPLRWHNRCLKRLQHIHQSQCHRTETSVHCVIFQHATFHKSTTQLIRLRGNPRDRPYLMFTSDWRSVLTPRITGHLSAASAHLIPNIPRGLWEMAVEPLTLALGLSSDISQAVKSLWLARPAGCFPCGLCFAIVLFHRLAPNESRGL